MPDAPENPIDTPLPTLGRLVLPMQPLPAGIWHRTPAVQLPAGCAAVRGTVSPPQPLRESPQLDCQVRFVFFGASGAEIRGCGCGIAARNEFEADELVPATGHEAGAQPGEFPPIAENFYYVVNDSVGPQQFPYGSSVAIEFKIEHMGDPQISAAATIEAFDASGNSLGLS